MASGAPRALIFEEDAVLTAEGVRRAGALGRRLADYAAAARDDLGGGDPGGGHTTSFEPHRGSAAAATETFDVVLLGYIRGCAAVTSSSRAPCVFHS